MNPLSFLLPLLQGAEVPGRGHRHDGGVWTIDTPRAMTMLDYI
jgi:hypothetical protein